MIQVETDNTRLWTCPEVPPAMFAAVTSLSQYDNKLFRCLATWSASSLVGTRTTARVACSAFPALKWCTARNEYFHKLKRRLQFYYSRPFEQEVYSKPLSFHCQSELSLRCLGLRVPVGLPCSEQESVEQNQDPRELLINENLLC